MRIEIRGRNVEMTDDLREMVRKRFQRLGRQVSDLATLEVVLSEERNPSIADSQIAEATFYLKGVTLHAREASPEMAHSVRDSPRTSTGRSRNTANCAVSGVGRGIWSTRCGGGRRRCIRS